MEKFTVSRLIGAPPGYVGYEDSGYLTKEVRRRPYSVVLLDEIEKAHPDVFNILLQVLDEGHLTDNYGRKIDFKNTVVIMTSNVGARRITGKSAMGFQKPDTKTRVEGIKTRVQEEIEKTFNPEFLNRLDEVIVFHPLDREQIKRIVDILARDILKRLAERELRIVLSEEAKGFLVDKGFNEKFGARPLKRAMQRYLEDPLSESILEGNFERGSTVIVGVAGDALRFTEAGRQEETVGGEVT
jgi:ATP-dependent Clp protease ATP-binding subunit ClpC